MKKLLLFFLSIILCTGCTKSSSDVNQKQLDRYNSVVKILKKGHADTECPCDIKVKYYKLGNYYSYNVIIDNPKESMYNIQALSYSPEIKDEYHPSIGFFDSHPYHLVLNKIDKKQYFYKGIAISGRVYKKTSIRVFIRYYEDKDHMKMKTSYKEIVNEN